jgi:adenine-specific DNA glycosylase
LSRYFDETDIAWPKKRICSTGFELMPKNDPAFQSGHYGFGALQCVPKSPDCRYAFLIVVVLHCKKKVDQLPVKSKR